MLFCPLLFLLADEDLRFLALGVAETSDGGKRDFVISEVRLRPSSRSVSKESRIPLNDFPYPSL
jgi:hypothetical protein